MDAALVLAVLVLMRMLVGYFGTTSVAPAGHYFLAITSPLVPPVAGGHSMPTPYGGQFSLDATAVIVILLFVEWVFAAALGRSQPELKGSANDREGD
jgi:hypothetical protein